MTFGRDISKIKLFSPKEVEYLMNCMDMFRYDSIYYIPESDEYYLAFDGDENMNNDSENALNYIKKEFTQ